MACEQVDHVFTSFRFCLPFYPPIPSASIFFQMIKLPMFKTSGKSHLMALIHGYLMAVFIDDGPCPMKFFLPLVAHNWCMCLIISFIANSYTISSYQQTLLHTKSAKSLCHCTAYCWADCLQLSMAQCNTQMEKWTWFKYFQLAMRCYYLMHLFSISIVQIPSFEGFGAVNIVWKGTFWADAFLGHTSQCNMWLEYAHLHATHQH